MRGQDHASLQAAVAFLAGAGELTSQIHTLRSTTRLKAAVPCEIRGFLTAADQGQRIAIPAVGLNSLPDSFAMMGRLARRLLSAITV